MSLERRGGARAGAGKKPRVSHEAKTLLAKDFRSLAQDIDVPDANLPAPQPWHLLQTATQAYEKADKKFAAAVLQVKNAKANLGHVATNAEQAQHKLRQCIDKMSELQDLYNADPVNRQDEFMQLDELQKEKEALEIKLVALAEQVACAEDLVRLCAFAPVRSQTCCAC